MSKQDLRTTLTFNSSGNKNTRPLRLDEDTKSLVTELEVSNFSGSSKEVIVTPQFSYDKLNWINAVDLQKITSNNTIYKNIKKLARFVRFKITVNGSSISATVDLHAEQDTVLEPHLKPEVDNVSIPDNTQQSLNIPDNAVYMFVKHKNDGNPDTTNRLLINYDGGNNWITIPVGSSGKNLDQTNLQNDTLYYKAPNDTGTLEIEFHKA